MKMFVLLKIVVFIFFNNDKFMAKELMLQMGTNVKNSYRALPDLNIKSS